MKLCKKTRPETYEHWRPVFAWIPTRTLYAWHPGEGHEYSYVVWLEKLWRRRVGGNCWEYYPYIKSFDDDLDEVAELKRLGGKGTKE